MAIEKECESVERRLADAGIRISPARVLTLRTLLAASRPLSAQEIEDALETLDRSSITRTLQTFCDAHLLHQISDGSGSMRYEVCRDIGHSRAHSDQHAHFHCRSCGETVCLTDLEIRLPGLPEGYKAENTTYVITGLCPKCNRHEI